MLLQPNKTKPFGLSKSKVSAYEQCPKRLWLMTHKPELAAYDDQAQARFAEGHAIGEIACELCPGGVMIEALPDLRAALAATKCLIEKGHPGPIFEATFEHDGVLVRVDILERTPDGRWAMREVKSSTGVKDYHRGDLCTQIWVLEQAGVELAAASIRHVDREFVLHSVGDYAGLFRDHELLNELQELATGRGKLVAGIRETLAGEEPVIEVGDHCGSPFPCEFSGCCHVADEDAPAWPVSLLPYGAGKRWEKEGISDLLALDEADLGSRDARIVAATRSGKPFHDLKSARQTMDQWEYPRAWLDFETIGFAVPRWIGTKPYQQIPFQFSLHLEQADGSITHHEFLSIDGEDPRKDCAKALVELIPCRATPVAYNASFERRVLRELAAAFPEFLKRLNTIADGLVDLLPVARDCWYHRDQRGSWSIKAVLPTIANLDYGRLDVQDGSQAQKAYLEAIDPATEPDRRSAIDLGLRAYCRQDTLAMVIIARQFLGRDIANLL
ncbi:hypothetical protein A9K71_25865 [Mesorhizobium sp. WSM3873]|nr:hypothetical protein A9K71_25865 [Mesorhizobium sp. WSM3873]